MLTWRLLNAQRLLTWRQMSAKRMLMWRQMDAKRMLTWRLLDAQNYEDLNFFCLFRGEGVKIWFFYLYRGGQWAKIFDRSKVFIKWQGPFKTTFDERQPWIEAESRILLSGSSSSLTVFWFLQGKMNLTCDFNIFSREGSSSMLAALATNLMSE